MLPDENLYNACEIHSHPEVFARPARPEDKAKSIKYRPARRAHPARRGILRIGKTQFYRQIDGGRFPEPDTSSNGHPCWTGKLLNSVLYNKVES